jgi:anti-anti-sigma regulatory factor
MPSKPGSEVQGEAARNLIQIRYRGRVAAAEMKACADKVAALLPQMRPGFMILTDLSGLDSMELSCVAALTKMMDACKAKGVGTVVRIVPDPAKDIGFNILSVIHYRRGVKIVTCETAAEAARVL